MIHRISLFLSLWFLLMLVSCSTQIQLTCLSPSESGLVKGSSLTIRHHPSSTARKVSEYLTRELQQNGFYTLAPEGEYLLMLDHASEHTGTAPHINEDEAGTFNRETDICARIRLSRKSTGTTIYTKHYCQRADGEWADMDGLCRLIVKDLLPHRITYYETLKPPANNPFFTQSVKCCHDGQWESAAQLARKAIALQPDELETHHLLGLIERELGHYQASSDCFQRAQRPNAARDNSILQKAETVALHELRLQPGDRSWKHHTQLHSYRKKKETTMAEFLGGAILESLSPAPLPPL